MKFEEININDITPADYNPRVMPADEMEKLKNNLQTYGLIDPIIIDLTDNNTIIGGHQRLTALKEIHPDITLKLLKLGDLGLVFNETNIKIKDKNDQKSMNLSLNKIRGDWDYDLLENLFTDLSEDGYVLELTGFDKEEINLLIDDEDYDLDEGLDIENKINDALNQITGGMKENEEESYGVEKNFKVTIYSANEELFLKFLEYLNVPPMKQNRNRTVKLEEISCIKELDMD